MKLAICVGHSRMIPSGKTMRYEGGAVNVIGDNERTFNLDVAKLIKHRFPNSIIFDHYEGSSYTRSMLNLAADIKKRGCDLAIELHFNAGGGTGHEWLYWHTSKNGKRLAEACDTAAREILKLPARGILPRKSGRGAVFLSETHCPAIIGEPFFGDSEKDVNESTREKVARVYIEAINIYGGYV